MLTLRQALQLPVFEKANVIAGESGLDRIIRRIHVVDIPDAEYHTYGQGLLLFTSGYGIKDNAAEQAALIPKLAESGAIGMVFSLGWYFNEVPAVMLAEAEQRGFPILTVPHDLGGVRISRPSIFHRPQEVAGQLRLGNAGGCELCTGAGDAIKGARGAA